MAGQIQRLRERIQTTTQLQSVVDTIRALAEVNVRRAQAAARDAEQYARTVHVALHVALRAVSRQDRRRRFASEVRRAAPVPLVAVVVTSDQGLCGAFHHRITSYALDFLAREAPDKSQRSVIAVGYRGFEKLKAAGETILAYCDGAGSTEAIPSVVSQVLLALDDPLRSSRLGRLVVMANRPEPGGGFRETHFQLYPFDARRFLALPAGEPPFRTVPRHDLDPRALLQQLVREQLYVDLWQALVDSFVAENSARLSAMRTAADNIEDRLVELQAEYRRQRQEWITQELMDVMGGVEAARAMAEAKAAGAARGGVADAACRR
ncbi:MAG: F0F1 ATP synthase subunit gamma [Firmicutes bacterium]|nr:F0F1 ATP synthase subunit gamma [Bacillota bacterium]